MQHVAQLIQTVLWVGLIGAALWGFYAPIYDLLVALQRRVEAGSNFKAGPFELTDQLKPQDPGTQKAEAELSVREMTGAAERDARQPLNHESAQLASVQATYFQAEDLVLRALQSEYGAAISRQVSAGPDFRIDGAFTTNGRLNIVEVKYVVGLGDAIPRLRDAVTNLTAAVTRYGWHNVQIILAVVLEKTDDVVGCAERLRELATAGPIPVVVRCFALSDLRAKFGIGPTSSG